MAGASETAATFPVPPPLGAIQLVDPQTGKFTMLGLSFMTELWASLQGGGGVIDQITELQREVATIFGLHGDGTLSTDGVLTINSSQGRIFVASAFIDTTDASNITSGILPPARIGDGSIVYAKLQDETDVTILGRSAGSSGPPMEIAIGSGLALAGGVLSGTGGGGGVTSVAFTGDGTIYNATVPGSPITTTGTFAPTLHTQSANTGLWGPASGAAAAPTFRAPVTADLPNSIVTYAKIQNETATTLLGNPTGSGAAPSEITLGSGLSFSGSVLNVAGTSFANPSGLIGLTAANGTATTAERSDATHALSQAIAPSWTGMHQFTVPDLHSVGSASAPGIAFIGNTGDGIWRQTTTNGAAVEISLGGVESFRFGLTAGGKPRLSLGTFISDAISPNATLYSAVSGGTANNFALIGEGGVNNNAEAFVASTASAIYATIKGRGTIGAFAPPNLGDFLGNYQFSGQNTSGATVSVSVSARIRSIVTETATYSATAAGGDMLFGAVKIGTATVVDVARLSADTGLAINSVQIATAAGVLQPAAFGSQTANTFLAAPNGSSGAPSFRAIAAADLPGSFAGFANPSGLIGLTAVNGVATTGTRSDATHAIDQSIAPTWTGVHNFNGTTTNFQGGNVVIGATAITASVAGAGYSFVNMAEGPTTFSNQVYSTLSNAVYALSKARGTIASPSVPLTNDTLGIVRFRGFTTGSSFGIGADIEAVAKQTTWSASALGTYLIVQTVKLGATALTEVARFDADNGISAFGTVVIDANRLLILRQFTVATLPSAPAIMATASVSDATLGLSAGLGLAPIGGGTNKVPTYYDGAWKIG